MNINIYLEDSLGNYLNQYAKQSGKSRNALIREAVKEWVVHQGIKQWPDSVLTFSGIEEIPAFESYRDELLPPKENPLA
jgi:hypothetical protein